MSALAITGQIGSGQTALDHGISDIIIAATEAGQVLYTTSGPMGGVTAYLVGANGALTLLDTSYFNGAWAEGTMSNLTLLHGSGGTQSLVVAADGSDGLVGYELEPDGDLGGTSTFAPNGTLPLTLELDQWGSDMLFLSATGQPGLIGYDMASNGSLSQRVMVQDTASTYASSVFAIETVTLNGQDYLIAACQVECGVTAYQIGETHLMATGSMGSAEGLGIMTPTDLAVVEVEGTAFIVVASAPSDGVGQSGALTVLEMAEDGSLVPTDHVFDTLDTRFGSVQSLSVVELDGRTYVLAAGGDDGLSAFVLTPNGRLLLTDTIADTPVAGLENITSIAAFGSGDTVQMYVASEISAGLTALTLDIAGQGQTRQVDGAATGGSQNDILIGGGQDDTIDGGGGDDILEDGQGSDQLIGGAGADLFSLRADASYDAILDFDWTEDRLDLSDWPFFYDPSGLTIQSTAFGATLIWRNETLDLFSDNGQSLSAIQVLHAVVSGVNRPPSLAELGATAGDQSLIGSVLGDAIYGGGGQDTIHGENGHDLLDGGEGRDVLSGGQGNDSLDGGSQDDTLDGGSGHDSLLGGDGHDSLVGGSGHDIAQGGAGRDHIDGQSGDDVIEGDEGDDTLMGGGGFDTLSGGDGHDRLFGDGNIDQLFGGDGNDTIDGGSGGDYIQGNAGADVLDGSGGNDRIRGDNGSDTLHGSGGFDTLFGDDGDDVLDGGGNADELYGGQGADTLFGGDGGDRVNGGNDGDWIEGGGGRDLIAGGSGDDTVLGGTGHDRIEGQGGDDSVDGGADDDRLIGAGGFDTLMGGDGHDYAHGGSNIDHLHGGSGDDTLIGGSGGDHLYGDEGQDSLDGGFGNDRIRGGNDDDVVVGGSGFDTLFGDDGADTLDGGGNADQLSGGHGADLLLGGGGTDTLSGGSGSDTLEGGNENDTLEGGSGFDTLIGGSGNDLLTGGGNADVFVFADGHGDDTISDFSATSATEIIDLSAVTFLNDIGDVLGPAGAATQVGTSVRIPTGSGIINLVGVDLNDLDASDFLF